MRKKGSAESYKGPWDGRCSGKKNFWENPPIPTFDKDVQDDEGEDEDDADSEALDGEKVISQHLQEVNVPEDADCIASEISVNHSRIN